MFRQLTKLYNNLGQKYDKTFINMSGAMAVISDRRMHIGCIKIKMI